MNNDMKNEKDKSIGKIKEAAGKFLDNDELEFEGKKQSIKGDIGSKLDDMKDDALKKANDLIDKVRNDKKDKE